MVDTRALGHSAQSKEKESIEFDEVWFTKFGLTLLLGVIRTPPYGLHLS